MLIGQIVSTPGAIEALAAEGATGLEFLRRDMAGDYSDLCEDDKRENDLSVKHDYHILSAYLLPRTNVKLWIIAAPMP